MRNFKTFAAPTKLLTSYLINKNFMSRGLTLKYLPPGNLTVVGFHIIEVRTEERGSHRKLFFFSYNA